MLLPVECPHCRKRIWIEVEFGYEKYVYARNFSELTRYLITHGVVRKVWEDEELAHEIREQFIRLIKSGDSIEKAVKIISELYGIPVIHVEEFLEDLIAEAKMIGYEKST